MIAALTLADMFLGTRRRFHSLEGEALRAYQDRRATAIVAYATAHAPFYARHYRGADLSRWRGLPTIDKQLMMENFDAINTRGVAREEALDVALESERRRDFRPRVRSLTVGLSSGTSGHRSLFLADRAEQARWIGVLLARLLPPFRIRGFTISLFSMSGSRLYDDLRGRWLRFHHHDLSMPPDAAARALNVEQPDILCAPPSYLEVLGELRALGDLRIAPRTVVSVAEVLEREVSASLSHRFGCTVREIYQSAEALVAISCDRGRLHVQEDVVAVQFEPFSGARAAAGAATPIITDLWHRTLPVIRYRLEDVVTLATERCGCGSAFQVIEVVQGRRDDVCTFAHRAGGVRPVFPATIRRLVLLASGAVADYEAEQERPSHLRLRVLLKPGADVAQAVATLKEHVVAGLEEQGAVMPDVEVECGGWPAGPGKRRRVRCLAYHPRGGAEA